jgi:hypothetical protein
MQVNGPLDSPEIRESIPERAAKVGKIKTLPKANNSLKQY